MTSRRPTAGHSRRRGTGPVARGWTSFAGRWGWRAYALPVLTVVTLVALLRAVPPSPAAHEANGRTPYTTTNAVPRTPATFEGSGVHVEGMDGEAAGFDAGATPTPQPVVLDLGEDVTSCDVSSYSRLVLVSLKTQRLWACEGRRQVFETVVTTGATVDHDQTPVGSWRVQAKQRDRYLVGPGYRDYVQYWIPFDGDFGFHDASWQTMPFGSRDYPRHGSHGCVHLPTAAMAWLYKWARVGQTVVTVEA